MPNKPWTKKEVNLLLNNKEVKTRSKKSILRKLISLGLRSPKFKIRKHIKKPWSKEEIDLLINGKYVPERTKESIRSMKVRLGLIHPKKNCGKKPWSEDQEEILIRLRSQGKSALEIYKMKVLPYSRNSIQKKICRIGLSKNSRNVVVFSKNDISKLKKFLIQNWKEKTPEQLVEIWNSNNSTAVNKRKIIYHLNSLGLNYAEVNELNKIEKIIKEEISHKSAKSMEEMIRSKRAEIMRKRMESNKDIWSGLDIAKNSYEDCTI
jgi:hypothetical protein